MVQLVEMAVAAAVCEWRVGGGIKDPLWRNDPWATEEARRQAQAKRNVRARQTSDLGNRDADTPPWRRPTEWLPDGAVGVAPPPPTWGQTEHPRLTTAGGRVAGVQPTHRSQWFGTPQMVQPWLAVL